MTTGGLTERDDRFRTEALRRALLQRQHATGAPHPAEGSRGTGEIAAEADVVDPEGQQRRPVPGGDALGEEVDFQLAVDAGAYRDAPGRARFTPGIEQGVLPGADEGAGGIR